MKIPVNKTGGRTTGTASNSLTRLTTGVLKPKLPKVTASSTTGSAIASSIQADKFKQAKAAHRQAKAALAKNPGNKRLQNLAVTTQGRAEKLNPKHSSLAGIGRRNKTYNTSYGPKSMYQLGQDAFNIYRENNKGFSNGLRTGTGTTSSGRGPTRKDIGITGTNAADKSIMPARSRGYNRALLDKYGSYESAAKAGFSPYKTKTGNNEGRANSDFKIPNPRPSKTASEAARRQAVKYRAAAQKKRAK